MNSPAVEGWHERTVLDFHMLLLRLWAGRWWIVASSFLLAVVALVIGFFTTTIYRATTVVIPATAEQSTLRSSLGSLNGLAALAGVNLGASDSATQEALGLLKSRQLGYDFIKDKNLLPLFFDDKWDAAKGKWLVPAEDEPTMADAYRYFDRNVRSVREDKRSGLITLQIDWRDRETAAAWANELVARLNAVMQRRAIDRADASLGFLAKELERTPVIDTRNAINRLVETQVNQRMIATVTQEYAFRVVDRAQTPDLHDKVRPHKLLMTLAGGFIGFLASMVGVLLFHRGGR
jgi:uncharacterized protein involved in exopolysaccharide biosynthesis